MLDQKLENGMETHNIACGSSGILLGLKLVKTTGKTARPSSGEYNNDTNVLVELVVLWNDRKRIICAHSHFASVHAAGTLLGMNLRFLGVVKTATSRLLIGYLNRKPMYDKGDSISLTTKITVNGQVKQIDGISRLDRNRIAFVTTAGNMQKSCLQTCTLWSQFGDGACPVQINIEVRQSVFEYFEATGIIDQHNRVRQDSLDLEKSIEVK